MSPSTEGVDEESSILAGGGRPMNGGSVFRADFQQVRRGYAPDEVTAHLRLVAEHMADLEARIKELDTQLAERQQSAGADAGDPYDVVAARIADLVRSFDEDVARMRLDAETEVDRIPQEAREQDLLLLEHEVRVLRVGQVREHLAGHPEGRYPVVGLLRGASEREGEPPDRVTVHHPTSAAQSHDA